MRPASPIRKTLSTGPFKYQRPGFQRRTRATCRARDGVIVRAPLIFQTAPRVCNNTAARAARASKLTALDGVAREKFQLQREEFQMNEFRPPDQRYERPQGWQQP